VIAYGCGMIFIYFLRYQLNFSYFQICTAPGPLLSDRYRSLTGATDDPAARVGKLLDSHFGDGLIYLVGDNPFPLYEGADRKLILGFGKPQSIGRPQPGQGIAHVKPFFLCPASDYQYSEVGYTVTYTITATTVGIGLPLFRWKLNGESLVSGESDDSVTVPVEVSQPGAPGQPVRQTQSFLFHYRIDTVFATDGSSSVLTLTNRSFAGDYQVEVYVDADERGAPTTTPASANQGIVIHTREVVYGGNYSADKEKCENTFVKSFVGKQEVVVDYLSRLHNLPDPPRPDYVRSILEAAQHIREELTSLATTDHQLATKIAHYAGNHVGVPAHFFLKGAHDPN
jgi:hypothetical protein